VGPGAAVSSAGSTSPTAATSQCTGAHTPASGPMPVTSVPTPAPRAASSTATAACMAWGLAAPAMSAHTAVCPSACGPPWTNTCARNTLRWPEHSSAVPHSVHVLCPSLSFPVSKCYPLSTTCLASGFLGIGGTPSLGWAAGWTGLGRGVRRRPAPSAQGTTGLAQKAVLPVLGVGEARAGAGRGRGRGLDLSPEAPGQSESQPILHRLGQTPCPQTGLVSLELAPVPSRLCWAAAGCTLPQHPHLPCETKSHPGWWTLGLRPTPTTQTTPGPGKGIK
jgi:hypothetical protein